MDPRQYDLIFDLEQTYWWHVGLRDLVLECVDRYVGGGPAARLLDAGCGSGMLLAALRDRGYTAAVGLDAAPRAVTLACRRGVGALACGSVEALPFADAQFDAVTCLDVLYHRMVREDAAAMREMWRVLRPSGILLVQVPAFELLRGPHDMVAHTRHRYRANELRRKLAEAGFGILRLTYRNSLLFPIALARRLAARWSPETTARSDVVPLPAPVNAVLTAMLRIENRLLRLVSLPAGLSVFCVARKWGRGGDGKG